MKPVRVLVVADATSFAGLKRLLHADAVQVVATASTKTGALTLLRRLCPDVVVFDLELSHTNAFQLLVQLVEQDLAPVLGLVSCGDSGELAARALAAGASDVMEQPSLRASFPDPCALRALTVRIEAVAASSHAARAKLQQVGAPVLRDHGSPLSSLRAAAPHTQLIAIGASTGGTSALADVLRQLPVDAIPVLVVQHMLSEFTRDFAERLNDACAMLVREANDGDRVTRGCVLVAPGGRHMRLARDRTGSLQVVVSDDAPVGKHRPSIDVLFWSCAEVAGSSVVGVLLTGMGDDGARGLRAMRDAGAGTIAQDQQTSVCFGMPSAAIERGAAQLVLPLQSIARSLIELQVAASSNL